MVRRRDSASSVLGTLESLLSIEDLKTALPTTTAAELIARSVGLNKSVLGGNTPTTIKQILDGGIDEDQQPYECAKRVLNRFVKKFSKTVGNVCALVAAEAGLLVEPLVNFPECKQPLDVAAAVAELVLLKPFLDDLIECDQTWLTAESVESLSDARCFFGLAKLVLKDRLPFQADLPLKDEDVGDTNDETSKDKDGEFQKRLRRVDDTDAFIINNLQSGHSEAVKRILSNLSASTFNMHELEALCKNSFLVDHLAHAKIMLEAIPEVENIMDIRVHEVFFKLLRKCLSQLSVAHRDEAIAFAFNKRGMAKLKKLGEVQAKELKEQWAAIIHSPERFAAASTSDLMELITWALIVDASTYFVDLLMAFMSEKMRAHVESVVKVLRDLRFIANVPVSGRPLLHCALDHVAKQWTWLWSQQKQKPPPLDRFGWLVQVICEKKENEPGVLSAGSILNSLLLPAAVEGSNSGYSSGLIAAAITQLLASDQIDIDFILSRRCADVWDAVDTAPTSVDPNAVEAPKMIHLVMQWYSEPATDDVQERRRCSLLGRLFESLDNRLRGREWPSSTVDWLKSKLSKHSWRVRHFLIKHLMAQSLGKQWPDEIPEKLRHFLDDPQAHSQDDGVVAIKELLSLMSVTTEPIAVDVVERLVEALPSKTPKQTVVVALSTALPTMLASHRSSEELSRLLSLLMEKVVGSSSPLSHDYLSAIHSVDTVDLLLAQSLNTTEVRDKAWLSLVDWFVDRIHHYATTIDNDSSLSDELRKIRYGILELNVAPIKFSSVETTPASMKKLYERLEKGAGRGSAPAEATKIVGAAETESAAVNELASVPAAPSTFPESKGVSRERADSGAKSKKKDRKSKNKQAERNGNRASGRRDDEGGQPQRSVGNRRESEQTGEDEEQGEKKRMSAESAVDSHPTVVNKETLTPTAVEEEHKEPVQGRQRLASRSCRNCDGEDHSIRECSKPMRCFRCNGVGHSSRDCPTTAVRAIMKPNRIVTCYGCGEDGHYRKDCPKATGDGNKQTDHPREPVSASDRPERPAQNVANAPPPNYNPIPTFPSTFAEGQPITVLDGPTFISTFNQNNRNNIQDDGAGYAVSQFEGEFAHPNENAPASGHSDRRFPQNSNRRKQSGHKTSQSFFPRRDGGGRFQNDHNTNGNRQNYGLTSKFNNDGPPPGPCQCGGMHWMRECPNRNPDRQSSRNTHQNSNQAPQQSFFSGRRGNYNSAGGGGSHRGDQQQLRGNQNARGGMAGGGGNFNNFNNGGNYPGEGYGRPPQAVGSHPPMPSTTATSHGLPMPMNYTSIPPPSFPRQYPAGGYHGPSP